MLLIATCCLAAAACNNPTTHTSTQAQTHDMAADDKHTVEYITQRLSNIYAEAFVEDTHDLFELDQKYMSQQYVQLQDKAMEIAERTDDIIIDADHWIQGQDWTYPTMEIVKIENITATTAIAHVTITSHIPDNEESTSAIILPLVFERGDWYIDNMQQYYEGELLDEKAWYQNYIKENGK